MAGQRLLKAGNRSKMSTPTKPGDYRVYSNDPAKSVKTFCCLCDQVVTVSGLRKHVKAHHKITLTEYKKLYGDHRKQIIQLVYHRCAFCKKSVLLDTDLMSKHLKKAHQATYKEYLVKHMVNLEKAGINSKVEEGKNVLGGRPATSLVVIKCDQCTKTFRQNIQLKIHKKKHSTGLV